MDEPVSTPVDTISHRWLTTSLSPDWSRSQPSRASVMDRLSSLRYTCNDAPRVIPVRALAHRGGRPPLEAGRGE